MNIKRVFLVSLLLLAETFSIIVIVQRDIIKMHIGLHIK